MLSHRVNYIIGPFAANPDILENNKEAGVRASST